MDRYTDDELVILVALIRAVLHADHEISAAEQDALAALQRQAGTDRWNAAVRAARERFPAIDVVLAELHRVRPGVRRHGMRLLAHLAGTDGSRAAEIDVLRQVAAEWGLTAPPAPDEDDDELLD
ncbi:MAG: hypothetical protein R3F59_07075 [Myxococcota bacterium]